MEGAVERVLSALKNGERITVHGDYDADGVTGSTVIINTLREIESRITNYELRSERNSKFEIRNSSVDYYIPHRDKEGYGLHRDTVPKLKERGTALIITVDCGIACVDEIALAKGQDMDVVVVDHHNFGEIVPDAFLIHPGLPDETYPFKGLAAVGVAYKFACALLATARERGIDVAEGWEKWLLDLVAIATVTDMVPLIGENRVLETYGLKVLNKTKRPGLRAILEMAGVELGNVTSETIGFGIGPRINAAGRMDHASLALRLMLSESMEEARDLAAELEQFNKLRQDSTKKMMVEAEAIFESQIADRESQNKIIVLWKENWSPSLVGLVAGRFAEKFSRPVIAVGFHEKQWIGSGRSIPSYNITDAVKAAGEGILTRSGGHGAACGFALEDGGRLPEFADRLRDHASSILDEELIPLLQIDAEVPLSFVSIENAERVAAMEPFGMGNPKPIFVSRRCKVLTCDTMGNGDAHIRLSLLDESGRRLKAVGFKMGSRLEEIKQSPEIDIVYTMTVNEWQGRRSAEAHVVDFGACKEV
jgi:single-stranded-DNA-specific exonuclease